MTPVCASDGKLYDNECSMIQSTCKTRLPIQFIRFPYDDEDDCSLDETTVTSQKTPDGTLVDAPVEKPIGENLVKSPVKKPDETTVNSETEERRKPEYNEG